MELIEALVLISILGNILLFLAVAALAVRLWIFDKVLKTVAERVLGNKQQPPQNIDPMTGMPTEISAMNTKGRGKKELDQLRPGYFG